jgi:hypothetical protein
MPPIGVGPRVRMPAPSSYCVADLLLYLCDDLFLSLTVSLSPSYSIHAAVQAVQAGGYRESENPLKLEVARRA